MANFCVACIQKLLMIFKLYEYCLQYEDICKYVRHL